MAHTHHGSLLWTRTTFSVHCSTAKLKETTQQVLPLGFILLLLLFIINLLNILTKIILLLLSFFAWFLLEEAIKHGDWFEQGTRGTQGACGRQRGIYEDTVLLSRREKGKETTWRFFFHIAGAKPQRNFRESPLVERSPSFPNRSPTNLGVLVKTFISHLLGPLKCPSATQTLVARSGKWWRTRAGWENTPAAAFPFPTFCTPMPSWGALPTGGRGGAAWLCGQAKPLQPVVLDKELGGGLWLALQLRRGL